jgi:hypothetical protein
MPLGVHSAWVRGVGTNLDQSEWVCVEVQAIGDDLGVEQWIRLKFTGSCPYELFKTLVFAASDPKDIPEDPQPSGRPPSLEPAPSPSRAAEAQK